jgi:hypothetical protein
MKKFITAIVTLAIATIFVGCQNQNPQTGNVFSHSSQSVQETTAHISITPQAATDRVESTTVSSTSKESVAKPISDLINEYGTGEINLDLSFDEIKTVLDSYGINYKGEFGYIEFDDGTFYDGEFFYMKSTQKGLAVGDSIEKIKQIYGEPQSLNESGGCIYFVYDFNKKDKDGKRILFEVVAEKNNVWSIALHREEDYSSLSGAAAP